MGQPVALVTGGSRGIGLAVAEAAARNGYAVAITSRKRVDLDRAEERVRAAGAGSVATVAADLRDPESPARVLTAVTAKLGRPELLVNNAGTAPTHRFERTDDAMIDEVIDLHLKAPFRLIRALLPGLRDADSGCLVQIGSTAGLRGFALTAAYTAAKHAMIGMTRALAEELRDTGVGCYAICPGFVDTDITRSAAQQIAKRGHKTVDQALEAMSSMNRIGRMHSPAEVAEAVMDVCTRRPDGIVLELDADPPTFV